MEKQWFTISVYSENNVGLLNRISGIFLKRHINVESLNVSKSEIDDVSKFTIVVNTTEKWVNNIVGQLEKQIEVIKAFYHTDDETIYQESALFKIDSALLFDERQIQNIIKDSNSQIVTVARDFFVLALLQGERRNLSSPSATKPATRWIKLHQEGRDSTLRTIDTI